MEQPQRKKHRLSGYDYSAPGGYFITICAKEKRNLFWASNQLIDGQPILTPTGKIVLCCIQAIPTHYPGVRLDVFNIMPNHIHLVLAVTAPSSVSIAHVIQQMKRSVTIQAGILVWQRDYYDHVIRNDTEYQNIWRYVAYNHWKWLDDCYFTPDDFHHR